MKLFPHCKILFKVTVGLVSGLDPKIFLLISTNGAFCFVVHSCFPQNYDVVEEGAYSWQHQPFTLLGVQRKAARKGGHNWARSLNLI